MAGRPFSNITELNYDALSWCDVQNKKYHKGVYCVPDEKHSEECMKVARPLQITKDVLIYLWQERKISFDGFINFEGRRFGVPYWYTERVARVSRQEYILIIRSDDLSRKLAEHDVAPITTQMHQREGKNQSRLGNFNFDKEVEM